MKTFISIAFIFLIMSTVSIAQNKDVDYIFKKFEGKKGVTSVNISNFMIGLASLFASKDSSAKAILSQLRDFRILAFDEASNEDKESFNTMVKSLSLSGYKELMVVRDKENIVKMVIRENHGKISEFLLLATDTSNPVIIQINGNIDPKKLAELSACSGISGMQHLALINGKQ